MLQAWSQNPHLHHFSLLLNFFNFLISVVFQFIFIQINSYSLKLFHYFEIFPVKESFLCLSVSFIYHLSLLTHACNHCRFDLQLLIFVINLFHIAKYVNYAEKWEICYFHNRKIPNFNCFISFLYLGRL